MLDEGVDIERLSTGIFAGTTRRRLQIIKRLGRVLRLSEYKQIPLIILIIANDTEEDPRQPNNENLENSPFGIICEQANKPIMHLKLGQESEVKSFLSTLLEIEN